MTEVRLLYGNEIQWAVNVAREAFVAGMSSNIRSKEEVDRFYGEVTPEKVWQEGNAGTLFPWGAFKGGQLCAVGAIRKEGQITMLYVHPNFQKQGMGTLLLNAMRDYAIVALHLSKVTIEVTPVTLAPYFYKRGFAVAPQGTDAVGSVWLECRLCPAQPTPQNPPMSQVQPAPQGVAQENPGVPSQQFYPQGSQLVSPQQPQKPLRVTYQKKKVSARVILTLTAVVLAASFAVISGITLYHLAKEDRYTMKDYYDIMQEKQL